ncbi:carbon monoxide dehydrogenase maturation protein [Amycolatopsis sp. CA-230715]|uniref:carbon monoxide dehydrogenase maturation protein n=1 Tax=Amycolatopsis sp. CA-230715 TaxID=2745196 RepID=UPI001C00DC7A|nr:carbon monoxide dehydrogenase maturation protein [Amycolatopsis sp. CA-230715]QWF81009.1 hypothetical protein HUW46_04434 [Amycolatopsis sp. CA-230715]
MLIALTSLKSSPGVSTLAVTLAQRWPQADLTRRIVAECDPAGGDLAMRFGLDPAPGLVSLAAAARRASGPAVVWEHTQLLPSGARAIVAPPGGAHARAALHTLITAPDGPLLDATAAEPGVVVLADCGRADPGSPAEAIARQADALLLVSGARGEDLAHVATRLSELARWTPRPGLLLSGQGYPTPEIERELGVPVMGRIPHDPRAATHHGDTPGSAESGLPRFAAALARILAAPPPPTSTPRSGLPPSIPGVPDRRLRDPGRPLTGPPHTPPTPSPPPGTPAPCPPPWNAYGDQPRQPGDTGREVTP